VARPETEPPSPRRWALLLGALLAGALGAGLMFAVLAGMGFLDDSADPVASPPVTIVERVTELVPVDPNTGNNAAQLSVSVAEELSNGAVQALGSAGVLSLTQGDVDGDGDLDLVLGTEAGRSTEVYLGSGTRTFLEPPLLVPDNTATEGVALTDIDDDADLDLILVSAGGQPDQIFANDGTGVFTKTTIDTTAPGVRSVIADDLDGYVGLAISAGGGVASAALLLAVFFRPPPA